jgi:hypothetical protein
MALTKSLRRNLLALAAFASVSALACSDDGSSGGGAGPAEDLSDVIYEAEATDEALEALLAQSPKDEPAEAAQLSEPLDAAELDGATPVRFAWSVGPTARLRHEGPLEKALGFVLGVREAYAHGTPVSGRGYWLVFATAEDPKVLRVFTLDLSYTPDDAAWAKLKAATGPINVSVTNAIFEENRVTPDGGPFAGPSIEFTIL